MHCVHFVNMKKNAVRPQISASGRQRGLYEHNEAA